MTNLYYRDILYRLAKVTQPQNSLIISEFPKSGGTWFSLLVSDVIRKTVSNFYSSYSCVIDIDMRSFFLLSLLNPSLSLPTVLKTHRRAHFGMRNVIVLYRNLLDTYTSYYRFLLENKVISELGFDQFLFHPKYGINNWYEFYSSYVSLSKRFGHNVLFVSYESLVSSLLNHKTDPLVPLLSSSGFNFDSVYPNSSFALHFDRLIHAHEVKSYFSAQSQSYPFRPLDYNAFLHHQKPSFSISSSSSRAVDALNSRFLSLLGSLTHD